MSGPMVLTGSQQLASAPRESVWLSASAGTGKTQVLTARVLRLLLGGADPSAILCLTFTKAGAAEMADRIHAKLARWVRMKDADLGLELRQIGEDPSPSNREHARTLFARVLDAHGSGLRIQTIHSFCQALLASFPVEAGLIPGFRPIEPREEVVLARRVMAEMLVDAEARGDDVLLGAIRALSLRLGEGGAEGFLTRCAKAPDALEALGDDLQGAIRRALDVPEGDVEASIVAACRDDMFDIDTLCFLEGANAAWGTGRGQERAQIIRAWLESEPSERAATLKDLHRVWTKGDGEQLTCGKGWAPQIPEYEPACRAMYEAVKALLDLRARAALADLLAAGLAAGRTYARAYAAAKRTAGLIDFDDLIRETVKLLGQSHMAEWIRFKLDQATDHILIDEAQDTNAAQWAIVRALADEFFAEALDPEQAAKARTIFSVGDFKQAIFGFQGTDPRFFGAAQAYFARRAREAGRELHDLSLVQSFRSTAPILEFVDAVLGTLGEGALSALIAAEPHRSGVDGPGQVTLWKPVTDEAEDGELEGDEGWLPNATRKFAAMLARQVKAWLDEKPVINNRGKPRQLRPEDILILVRRRSDLAQLIVARLHEEGVPVAGVDRLRLNAPLAVRDLLAAIRFVLQPDDELNLAALLVSPLIGWSQDELYQAAFGRRAKLWRHLRETQPRERLAPLHAMLAMADFTTPYRFLEEILSGPLDGRRKLLERLGREARDPIEELLNAALAFERDATPSLQTFLDRFERDTADVKRDPSAPLDAVRVMTAHGAKGLQAPVVILADATVDPASSPRRSLDWPVLEEADPIPVFRPRKDEIAGSLAAAAEEADRREMEEHWRLLYVALTRAEERLVIGGALGPRAKGVAPEKSWHAAAERAFAALAIEPAACPTWGSTRNYFGRSPCKPLSAGREPEATIEPPTALPDWLTRPAPAEARPPRPLAPSSLGPDLVASPPPTEALREAAERGRLLHALFERLPGVPAADREAAAGHWLEHSAGVGDAGRRAELVRDACRIIGDPAYAELFGPDSLAEAPIAAVVEGEVIAGTVDRLLVTPERVRIVDFKTVRRAPASLAAVPEHHLRQMSAYAEALKVIFPDRAVEAALLYTATPILFDLPPALLAEHKPGLRVEQQSFA